MSNKGRTERFFRVYMPCLAKLWDWIWPRGEPRVPPRDIRTVSANLSPSPVLSSPIYAALYDFTARGEGELSVQEGEMISVIQYVGDFVLAKKLGGTGVEGLVPTNYVRLVSVNDPFFNEPWYFGNTTRSEAERLLLSDLNQHGSFLVRASESKPGGYSISVRNENKVNHFRVQTHPDLSFYVQDSKEFATMTDLIAFYRTNWKLFGVPLTKPCVAAKQEIYSNPDGWEQPKEDFSLIKKLGEGNFGEVWEGKWKNEYRVAIKMLKQDDMRQDEFVKEVQALTSLRHPKLIQLYAVCSREDPVYIVTELMTKGNLLDYLHSPEGKSLKMVHMVYIASQVAEGMAFLEEKNIVHRDLAARNILVADNLICKVADFGLARLLRQDVYTAKAGAKIPVKWTAPEAANYQKYSVKSDVWAFGILLYEIVTYGGHPYEGMSNREALEQIDQGYRLPCPNTCIPEVYRLMKDCWHEEERMRPTFSSLKNELDQIYTFLYR
ncbi:tyrosine-protein kinase Srms [Latimeria chalumnae]|uniref:tyrosine-protein kinase Srms n=1 Tax=Latimeria chalumnae TaxID=7897 RepID=UPI0003C1AF7B|nr:PREDICTED: tyrosine-protein kinase Srms [Latimeria chalumnae]|eukprot:XP_006012831.1 PREDICTED: tyrosine-protein kinase Srms [Latimeria chalumnae]